VYGGEITVALGYRFGDVRIAPLDLIDERYQSYAFYRKYDERASHDEQEYTSSDEYADEGKVNEHVVIVKPLKLKYISMDPFSECEFPYGTLTSLYIVKGLVDTIIFTPHMRLLSREETVSLIKDLEERLKSAKWRPVRHEKYKDLGTFVDDTRNDQSWRYASGWRNGEKELAEIRCERRERSTPVLSRLSKVLWRERRFSVSVHFNSEPAMVETPYLLQPTG
jgi:hypothetical protein